MTGQGLDLMQEAVRVLRQDLAAQLSGEPRYLALLTANAVATARREGLVTGRLEAAEAQVRVSVSDIRSGAHDDDAALYATLLHAAALRAWVADPEALTAAEREAHVGDPGHES